jgi:putative membrane protein
LSALFAFLHHAAAFALVAALAVELVLLRGELSAARARQVLAADAVYGFSAMIILIVGLLRVFYFEKGGGYYFHSMPFLAKLSLFAIIGLVSIYPTVQFMKWRPALRQGVAPALADDTRHRLRRIVHLELGLVLLLLLCAALMARGIGSFG